MNIGARLSVFGVAVALSAGQASAERIFGLTTNNHIVTFNSTAPATITSSGAITGLAAGEKLTGIDLRPSDQKLYSLSTIGNLYTFTGNASAGYVANLIGNIGVAITGTRSGDDFNPVADRLRFITDTDQNLRINPTTAATTVDTAITGPGGSNLNIVGAAYTNSFPGALTTTLYAIDALTSSLVRSTNPNGGTYTNLNTLGNAFGTLGFNVGAEGGVGFDISGATGTAFLNRGIGFYRVDLITGHATLLGRPGVLVDITAASVPEPQTWVFAIAGFALVGVASRRRQRLSATLA